MQIVPTRDQENTLEEEKLCAESNEPAYVTKKGYGRLVVKSSKLDEDGWIPDCCSGYGEDRSPDKSLIQSDHLIIRYSLTTG